MSKLSINGGTDMGVVALFDTSCLPIKWSQKSVDQMKSEYRLVEMNMHSDGAFTLYLFIDDEIPKEVLEHCDLSGADNDFQPIIKEKLITVSGGIGFGGLESVTQRADDPNIRNDIKIPPGQYEVNVYISDFLDASEEKEIETQNSIGENNLKRIRIYDYLWRASISFFSLGWILFILLGFYTTVVDSQLNNLQFYIFAVFGVCAAITFCVGKWYSKRYQIKQLRQMISQYNLDWGSRQLIGLIAQLIRVK